DAKSAFASGGAAAPGLEGGGRFARHGRRPPDEPGGTLVGAADLGPLAEDEPPPDDLPRPPLERSGEDIPPEAVLHALGRIDRERLRLAQAEESEAVIEFAVAEENRRNRRVARCTGGQRREAVDLTADVSGDVEQHAVHAVRGDRGALLRRRTRGDGPFTHTAAIQAAAVPLRKATARSRA